MGSFVTWVIVCNQVNNRCIIFFFFLTWLDANSLFDLTRLCNCHFFFGLLRLIWWLLWLLLLNAWASSRLFTFSLRDYRWRKIYIFLILLLLVFILLILLLLLLLLCYATICFVVFILLNLTFIMLKFRI